MRYFVTDYNGIPYKEQPKNGYTKLQIIERQKLEAAKNATENKFDELVPIISKAIGLYFNSHSFKIENGELKTVYASNNAATRL